MLALQRKPALAGQAVHQADLGLGDLVRVDAAVAPAVAVHLHHHPVRLGRVLQEDRLEHRHDEVHRRVVVVVEHDPEQRRLPELLLGLIDDLRARACGVRPASVDGAAGPRRSSSVTGRGRVPQYKPSGSAAQAGRPRRVRYTDRSVIRLTHRAQPPGGERSREPRLWPAPRRTSSPSSARAEILEAAYRVFAERGFEQATMAEIASGRPGSPRGRSTSTTRRSRTSTTRRSRQSAVDVDCAHQGGGRSGAHGVGEKIQAFIETKLRYFEEHRDFFRISEREFGYRRLRGHGQHAGTSMSCASSR